MSNKYSIGALLKKHNAIMNYLYNKEGDKIGVVVAMKGESKHHPKVGWALNQEVKCITQKKSKLRECPAIVALLDYIKVISNSDNKAARIALNETLKILKDSEFRVERSILTPENAYQRRELVELAIVRANYEDWDFYACRDDDLSQYDCDLRNDLISYYEYDFDEDIINEPNTEVAAIIRKAVRYISYRAFRYYK